METINIHETKTHLSKHLKKIENGESIIIARGGKPVAKLVPLEPADIAPEKRKLGGMEGVWKIPDDFDRMLEDEIADMFENGPLFPK